MKKLILLWLCLFSLQAFAKIDKPVHWKFASNKMDQKKYAVSFTADIEKGWHLYSQFLKSGGPVPTTFKFNNTKGMALVDKVTEKPEALSGFDQSFQMTIQYHEHQVIFTQIVYTKNLAAHLTGSLNYMVCSGQKCLPPSDVSFDIPVSGSGALLSGTIPAKPGPQNAKAIKVSGAQSPVNSDHSLLAIFIAGFLGGLAAFFLPCIYPMIPLTVSFFTKRSGTRLQGIKAAVIYGLSIIAIYVGQGLLITAIFMMSYCRHFFYPMILHSLTGRAMI